MLAKPKQHASVAQEGMLCRIQAWFTKHTSVMPVMAAILALCSPATRV